MLHATQVTGHRRHTRLVAIVISTASCHTNNSLCIFAPNLSTTTYTADIELMLVQEPSEDTTFEPRETAAASSGQTTLKELHARRVTYTGVMTHDNDVLSSMVW